MKKMFLSAFAVAALLFVGCTNDLTQETINGGAEAGKPMISSLTANLNSMTRTSLEFGDSKIAETLWSEGDVIGVVTEDNKVRKATLVKGAGTTTASFDIEGEEGDVYTAAFYPYIYNGNKDTNYSSVNGNPDNGSIGFNFPVVQFYDPNSVFATNTNTMVGIISGEEVSLYSTMGALEIRLKGSQTVHGITVKTADYKHKMAGPGVVDLTTLEPVMGETNASFSFIDLEVPGGVKLNTATATSFYVVLPAGEYKDLAIGVLTEDGSYMRTATKSHLVSTREILPINCGNLDEMVDKANAIDLCGGKYSNCYLVVPEAGKEKTYSFDIKRVDGTVVENHDWLYDRYVSEESASYPSHTTEAEIAPSFAHLLWAEDLGVAYDIHFDKAAGKIYFKNKAVGNARIMVMMNPNAAHTHAGNTLRCDAAMIWGWHIWACNEEPKIAMTTQPYMAGGGSKGADDQYHATREQIIAYSKSKPLGFMDRNLGATYAPKTVTEVKNMTAQQAADALGLYFQAGNLHPYPRPIEYAKGGSGDNKWDEWQRSVYMYGFHQYTQSWAGSSAAKSTIADNWNYPYYRYSANYTPNDQFSTTQNRTSWVKVDFRLGGTATSKDPIALWGGNGAKLNYDPCPKGYKVPHQGNLYQITTGQGFKFTETGATAEVSASAKTFSFVAPVKHNDQTIGNYITYDGTTVDFHPAGGYMGSGKITFNKTGNLSYLWGTPYSSNCEGNATNKAFNAAVKACFCDPVSSNNYTGLWPQPGTPYQIRCVKE